MPLQYLEFIKSKGRLTKPNIIIARDLAMDPLYYLMDNLEASLGMSVQARQGIVNERLRNRFRQYAEYSKGKPVVFVFDVHDFANYGGGQYFYMEFAMSIFGEYFDDIAEISPNELGPLYGIMRRSPIFLARSKQPLEN